MFNSVAEKSLSRVLMIGSAFVSILVVAGSVTDPVNVPKLFALGGVAGAGIAIVMSFGAKQIWSNYKAATCALILFSFTVLNSVLQSSAPINQLIYGSFGRNTGFITYLLLTFIFFSALGLTQQSSFLKQISLEDFIRKPE